jgi:two-component system phosphate regulon sensor histidine kinase PhoR
LALPLVDVVKQQVALFLPRAEERKLRLVISPNLESCQVLADRQCIDQVLSNLLDNAIKYCTSGDTIAVQWSVDAENRQVHIEVKDTGPGIAENHLPRLFERFYRIDTGRSRSLGGTGLGLSIVRHAVEAMKGQVSVDSEVGKGSTFRFTLQAA